MGTLITAHEALRPLAIPPEKISLVMNDMSRAPNSGPSGASRQQVVTGQAIKAACEQLVGAMRKPDGAYRTYAEMKAENVPTKYVGQWTAPATPPDLETSQGNPFSVYQYGVFLAEVEVDTKTGKTKVLKMTLCADVGVDLQPPRGRRPALRRPFPGHRVCLERGFRGYQEAFYHDRAEYRQALALDPTNVTALKELSVGLIRSGAYSEALPHLQLAHGLAPDDPAIGQLLEIITTMEHSAAAFPARQ